MDGFFFEIGMVDHLELEFYDFEKRSYVEKILNKDLEVT